MFFLIDCNNFYVSCERVFCPSLRKEAVVVLSNNDGCAIARSEEAKKMGIKMGEPFFKHKNKKITALSCNLSLYADMSNRVMQTLSSFGFPMQIYSIDEAFLHCENISTDKLQALGLAMKKKVKKWTGIDVSVGVGKTKTLAKLANKLAKNKSGVFVLKENITTILEKTEACLIWGIGSRLALRLKKQGIFSAKDLILQDEITIKKLLGVNGLRTVLELKETVCFSLEDDEDTRKSFACCRSFYEKTSSLEEIEKTIASYTQIVAEKLRKKSLYAEAMTIMLSTSPFEEKSYSNSITLSLTLPSNYTPDLIKMAKWGIKKLFKKEFSYKKCGIILLEIRKKPLQPSLLFSDPNKGKKAQVIQTVDRINKRFDKNTLYFAAAKKEITKPYKNKSGNYTTSWKDLPIIKK
jgi:DNA polymerase V